MWICWKYHIGIIILHQHIDIYNQGKPNKGLDIFCTKLRHLSFSLFLADSFTFFYIFTFALPHCHIWLFTLTLPHIHIHTLIFILFHTFIFTCCSVLCTVSTEGQNKWFVSSANKVSHFYFHTFTLILSLSHVHFYTFTVWAVQYVVRKFRRVQQVLNQMVWLFSK